MGFLKFNVNGAIQIFLMIVAKILNVLNFSHLIPCKSCVSAAFPFSYLGILIF